jgi:hypothetical protein
MRVRNGFCVLCIAVKEEVEVRFLFGIATFIVLCAGLLHQMKQKAMQYLAQVKSDLKTSVYRTAHFTGG